MGSNVGLGGEYMWGYRGEREKTDGKGGMKTVEKLGGVEEEGKKWEKRGVDTGHIGWKKMGVEVVRGGEEGRLGGGGYRGE